jgi:hypothetical protein
VNDQKKMGNVSRVSDLVKKKLEISFSPEVHNSVKPESNNPINTEVGKLVIQESGIYGNGGFKDISINTEIQKIQVRTPGDTKTKATFCLDKMAGEQLDAIYIKRFTMQQKSNRSALICEAIALLFEKENLE